ncbi:UNVERIFIED_CONTAM: hypothetical protein PYX00_005960 [Menopon gallinae]|uniref:Uncharacterized protein n=1 Tax=Menopon gallinae TaxID=328185 RepID=A0AAW2HTI9_9NEOP
MVWPRFEATPDTFGKTSSVRVPGGRGNDPVVGVVQEGETRMVTQGSLQETAEVSAKWKFLVASLTSDPATLTEKRVPKRK